MAKGRKDRIRYGSAYDPAHQKKKAEDAEAERIGFRPRITKIDPAKIKMMEESDRMNDLYKHLFDRSYNDVVADTLRGRDAWRLSAGFPEQQPADAAYEKARGAVKDWLETAPSQAMDDIVGNEGALDQLRDAIIAPAQQAELYAAYGLSMPKGVLLYGPPGCGKTMFARAAASEMQRLYSGKVEFINLAGNDLQSFWAGQTEQRIKAIFAFAREYKRKHGHPLLVFIDEADALLPDRSRSYEHQKGNVATFLAEMDGIHESGAFVMLATNRPDAIDEAVLRDGRCDFKVKVERPNEAALRTIVANNLGKIPRAAGQVELVNAAVESLLDPFKVLIEAQAIRANLAEKKVERFNRHFLLEHIVSGAMAASIPSRAARHAFARDKKEGTLSGITVDDVLAAVNDIFEQNKGLSHEMAFQDFVQDALAELGEK